MSRAYKVRFSTVTSENLTLHISLLGILTNDEMTALLREQLTADGWSPAPDGTLSVTVHGIKATLNQEGNAVQLEANLEREGDAWLDDDYSKEVKEQRLAAARANAETAMKTELMRKLEGTEAEVRDKLDQAVQRVYIEALKRKAASMGQIESLQEQRGDDGEYEITIKVRA